MVPDRARWRGPDLVSEAVSARPHRPTPPRMTGSPPYRSALNEVDPAGGDGPPTGLGAISAADLHDLWPGVFQRREASEVDRCRFRTAPDAQSVLAGGTSCAEDRPGLALGGERLGGGDELTFEFGDPGVLLGDETFQLPFELLEAEVPFLFDILAEELDLDLGVAQGHRRVGRDPRGWREGRRGCQTLAPFLGFDVIEAYHPGGTGVVLRPRWKAAHRRVFGPDLLVHGRAAHAEALRSRG